MVLVAVLLWYSFLTTYQDLLMEHGCAPYAAPAASAAATVAAAGSAEHSLRSELLRGASLLDRTMK